MTPQRSRLPAAPAEIRPDEQSGGAVAAGLALAVMAVLAVVLAVFQGPAPRERSIAGPAAPAAIARAALPPPAPAALQARLAAIAQAYRQPVGMAVIDIETGWVAEIDGQALYPQQSVSKLWVALSVLDAVDRGRLGLDDTVVMTDDDRSVFYQPLTARIGRDGHPITIRELLRHALAESDNSANDKLMAEVGGPSGVSTVLARKGLTGLRVGAAERDLQAGIAGMSWSREYGFGRAFQERRAELPDWRRDEAEAAYLADPPDGVTPVAVAQALADLKRERLLSPQAGAVMRQMMAQARTGPKRLKGGLPSDWSIAHKTGTGPDWRGGSVGINDVALITAPDGRAYAVAVMIRRTTRPVPERLAMFQKVSRAVVEAWRSEQAQAPLRR